MKYALLKHNKRATFKDWWRRYFWSRHEYWAKYAVYKATQRAKVARITGNGKYYFWSKVSLRAAAFCYRKYGFVPELLLRRPIEKSVFALSSPEVTRWIKIPPPFHSRKIDQ